jgi:hypothetical protein
VACTSLVALSKPQNKEMQRTKRPSATGASPLISVLGKRLAMSERRDEEAY